MSLMQDNLHDYIVGQTGFDDPILREMEERAERDKFPIIGNAVGPWLYFLTRMTNARNVFEMGSGYGYSTWFFARGGQGQWGRNGDSHGVG